MKTNIVFIDDAYDESTSLLMNPNHIAEGETIDIYIVNRRTSNLYISLNSSPTNQINIINNVSTLMIPQLAMIKITVFKSAGIAYLYTTDLTNYGFQSGTTSNRPDAKGAIGVVYFNISSNKLEVSTLSG